MTDSIEKKKAMCPTPHNTAQFGDFADVCLLPGDPHRSKLVATEFMEGAKLVNDARGVQGYTGTYKGKEISVMASGMGQPSMGIYSYELFNCYDVKSIIRIGSCGTYMPHLHAGDIIIGMGACDDGGYTSQFTTEGHFSPIADADLTFIAREICQSKDINFDCGNLLSSDKFYTPYSDPKEWMRMGVLGVEMEAAALYCNAAFLAKRALAIATVSDNIINPEENLTAEERQTSFLKMIEVGLETGIRAKDLPEKPSAGLPDLI